MGQLEAESMSQYVISGAHHAIEEMKENVTAPVRSLLSCVNVFRADC